MVFKCLFKWLFCCFELQWGLWDPPLLSSSPGLFEFFELQILGWQVLKAVIYPLDPPLVLSLYQLQSKAGSEVYLLCLVRYLVFRLDQRFFLRWSLQNSNICSLLEVYHDLRRRHFYEHVENWSVDSKLSYQREAYGRTIGRTWSIFFSHFLRGSRDVLVRSLWFI